jgi:hypothetical protein
MAPARLTIPAREALERAGNTSAPTRDDLVLRYAEPGAQIWDVDMVRPVASLVVAHRVGYGSPPLYIRTAEEPPWDGEVSAAWEHAAWTLGCPHRLCGLALLWDEAGRVPGSRLCPRGHRSQLSHDCRRVDRA